MHGTDQRYARIRILAETLRGDGHDPAVHPDDPQLAFQGLMVRCEPRADDGDHLWYLLDGEPLAEADGHHLMDAKLAIRARLNRVHVDVCGTGFVCLAADCSEPAQLWIKSEASPRTHYCPPHLVRRIWMYQEQNRGVEVSDAARAILDEVAV